MLISNRKNLLNSIGHFWLLMIRTFFRRVLAKDFRTDIVSELIVKIFLVHRSIIKSTYNSNSSIIHLSQTNSANYLKNT
jgi:hypothetical protein